MRLYYGSGRTSSSAQTDEFSGCFGAIEGSGELFDSGWKVPTCSEKLSTPPQTIETTPRSVSSVSFGQNPTGETLSDIA